MSFRRVTLQDIQAVAPFSKTSTECFATGLWSQRKPSFLEKSSPCREACPVGNDMARAFHLASSGDYNGALSLILQENPFPGVCGRVCYHPCERACNRSGWDQPINIRGLERFLSDHGKLQPPGNPRLRKTHLRVAVIGAGPCGLSAAYHLARLGYGVTVLETMPQPGGMLRYGIPGYRLPKTVLDREIEFIRETGVEILCATQAGRDISLEDLKKDFQALFLAVGAHRAVGLGMEGEGMAGVLKGIDFLRDLNMGREVQLGNRVVVVGGGNTALDCARSARRLGAPEVIVLYRKDREHMRALPEEVESAEREGVRILPLASPVRILEDGKRISALECIRFEPGPLEQKGSPLPVPVPDSRFSLPLDTLILAVGQLPQSSFAGELGLEVDHLGVIQTSPLSTATNLTGVFAGGDGAGAKAFVAHAIAEGKKGALAIHCFLQGKEPELELETLRIGTGNAFSLQPLLEPDGPASDLKRVVGMEQINTLCFPKAPRQENPLAPNGGFQESTAGLAPAQMEAEAGRCFKCGTCTGCDLCYLLCPDISIVKSKAGYRIRAEHCKGCGQCEATCPRHVLEMGGGD